MKRLVPVIVVLGCILFFYNLGSRDFWAPDEGDFAEIVKELSYDLVVPHLNGESYAEKPPLFYYVCYGAQRLFPGLPDEVCLRLPSAFFALLTLIAFGGTIRRFFGDDQAWTSTLILMTAPLYYWQARYLQVDMLFAAFVAGSLLSFFWFSATEKERYVYLFFLSLGLAFLTKGPLALVLTIPPAFVCLLLNKDFSLLKRKSLYLGALLFLAVILPWYLAVYAREGWSFLYENIIRQNFLRFFDAWSHKRPFYYYFTTLPLDFFPWSLLLPMGIIVAFRTFRKDGRLRFFLIWFLWMFLFLSISSGKISKYMLPALPALSVLAAAGLASDSPRYNKTVFLILAFLFFALGSLLIVFRTALYPEFYRLRLLQGSLCVAFSMVLQYPAFKGRFKQALFCIALLLIHIYSVANGAVYAKWNAYKSPRPFSEKVKDLTKDGTPWVYYGSLRGVYVYYAGTYAISVDEHDAAGLKAVAAKVPDFYIVTRNRDMEEVRETLPGVETQVTEKIGDTPMVIARFKRGT